MRVLRAFWSNAVSKGALQTVVKKFRKHRAREKETCAVILLRSNVGIRPSSGGEDLHIGKGNRMEIGQEVDLNTMIVTVRISTDLVNEECGIPWFGMATASKFKQRSDQRRAFGVAVDFDRKSLSTITFE